MKSLGKVLVIEDDKRWGNRLRRVLEKKGFHVTLLTTKEEGLDILKKEFFHFATVDLQLDEKTTSDEEFEGWQILEKILTFRLQNNMPTMVLTGFETENNKLIAFQKYKTMFFMKKSEWDREEFIRIVERVIKQLDVRFSNDNKGNF